MDKNTILSKITPTQIYLSFLNLEKKPNKNISSPFTTDNNPSFRIYDNGTFKCFSSGKQGDVFQFVADINNLDCQREFRTVIKIIEEQMNIQNLPWRSIKQIQKQSTQVTPSYFSFKKMPFSQNHLNYFMQGYWKVSKSILEKYNVSALKEFEYWNNQQKKVNKIPIFNDVIAFVYTINNNAEIYVPKQEKANKFIMNKTISDDVFGLEQLDDTNEYIIIAAGKKDCLILNSNKFPSVTFRSESHFPTESQIQLLKEKCKHLFVCYDNDDSGKKSMNLISETYDLLELNIPLEHNDIADFFQEDSQNLLNLLIKETIEVVEAQNEYTSENEFTIFHKAERILSKFYTFRFNIISLEIELRKKGFTEFESINEYSIYLFLQKNGIKISFNNLIALIKSDYVPQYNPIEDYFFNLPKWDQKTDHISHFASFVNATDKEQFIYHLKKWCVRTVKCALNSNYFNKQAFVFVHKEQNSGKTRLCRFLCPPILKNYIAEDLSDDKDSRILLCKNFLINLDELAGLSRKEINQLKSFFSKTQINERLPFGKKNTILTRVASFIGSTNEDTFLNDETGSVRWLCFNITGIDFNYSKDVNINHLWSQALALARDPNFDSEMTTEDIQLNEMRNKKHRIATIEYEVISKYIKRSNKEHGEFKTSTEIMLHLNPLKLKLNKIQIGKALVSLGFERIKNSSTQTYGYYVLILPLDYY